MNNIAGSLYFYPGTIELYLGKNSNEKHLSLLIFLKKEEISCGIFDFIPSYYLSTFNDVVILFEPR